MAGVVAEARARHVSSSAGRPRGPWLSIIVPVLDEAAQIRERLAALQRLRMRGAELVVADAGSSDDSLALAAGLADIRLTAPRGRGAQMHAGAAAASGEVLLFLHLDTTLPATAFEEIGVAVGDGRRWGRFDVRIAGRHPLLRVVERLMNLRSRLTGIVTGDQAIFVQRSLYEQVGGFPDIALMEDIALSKHLRRHARPACLRGPALTSARRWERYGVLRTIWLMWCLRAAYFFGANPRCLALHYGYKPRHD